MTEDAAMGILGEEGYRNLGLAEAEAFVSILDRVFECMEADGQ